MRDPSSVRADTANLIAVAEGQAARFALLISQVRADRLRRWSDPTYLPHTLIAGGAQWPCAEDIRARIRERLASGELNILDGMIVKARTNNGLCSACDLEIESGEAETLGYVYRDGVYHGFHSRCALLWDEERRSFQRQESTRPQSSQRQESTRPQSSQHQESTRPQSSQRQESTRPASSQHQESTRPPSSRESARPAPSV